MEKDVPNPKQPTQSHHEKDVSMKFYDAAKLLYLEMHQV